MRLKLAVISKSKWNSSQFVSLREQIAVSHRKIQKGVDLGIERERFINACNTIQQVGFNEAADIYFMDSEIDLDPNLLKTPILEMGSYSFIKQLRANSSDDIGGFITSTDIFYGNAIIVSSSIIKTVNPKFLDVISLLDDNRFKNNSLIHKLKYALSKGEPIGSSDKLDRHAKLIKSIRDFVFLKGNKNEQDPFVRFAYDDGSVGGEFYLFCLKEIDKPNPTENINLGLISNRHHELDNIIDYYLIRNSEISRGEDVFISDQEQIAYKKAFEFFELTLKSSNKKTIYQVNLYHTGLEAAVIGTYRAIIRILLDSEYRRKIIFKPFITENEILPEWF